MPAAPAATTESLRPLFDPRAVAVVGASDDPAKWGNWIAVRAQRGSHRRAVHFVNRRGGRVLGQPAHESLAKLPEPIELAVLAVPGPVLEHSVEEAIAAGARAIIAITGSEADGDAGGARDLAIALRAREAGVRLLGPNCLGVFDAGAELELVSNDLPAGPIALISQSGNLALEIGRHAARVGLGLSRFASLGNQVDVTAAELVRELVRHERTEVIAVYAEDFRDGRDFASAAAEAAAAGKPVVLLPIEHTEATARAVGSHTGALASDGVTIEAACEAGGILRVASPQQLVDVAEALVRQARPRGRRLAILADGGGHAGVAAGLAHSAGLEVPAFGPELVARLRAELPAAAAAANPIDLAGGGEQDIGCFARVCEELLASDEVDAVIVTGFFGGYGLYSEEMQRRELEVAEAIAAAATGERPLYFHSMHPEAPATVALRAGGVPVGPAIERTVETLGRLAAAASGSGVPSLPEPATPVTAHDYDATRQLLAEGGVPFTASRRVDGPEEAVAAAREIGYPAVVKALGLLHKSDAGGVVLGIEDDEELASTVSALEERLAPEAFSIERMAALDDGVELLVGSRWDPRFGPLLLVGMGGIHAETMGDVRVALAPVDPATAERLLLGLRGAPLLLGTRGRPPVEMKGLTAAVAAFSEVAAAHPELAELEVNPLLATPRGPIGLDARALPAAPGLSRRA